jgi:hypothetical protein
VRGFVNEPTDRSSQASARESTKDTIKRLKLAWKKPEIQDAIRELRDFTSDFGELTDRLVKDLTDCSLTSSGLSRRKSFAHYQKLRGYKQARLASQQIYDTLAGRWTCPRHKCHLATICCPENTDGLAEQHMIRFDLGIKSPEEDDDHESYLPKWLAIELVTGPEEPISTMDDSAAKLTRSLERHSRRALLEVPEKRQRRRLKKSDTLSEGPSKTSMAPVSESSLQGSMVTSEASSQTILEGSTSDITTLATISTESLGTDLESVQDFCLHLQTISKPNTTTQTPVGFISTPCLHRFYLPLTTRPCHQEKSLSELMSWIAEDDITRSFPQLTLLHLAGELACAVLRFFSTPWLPDTWQSQDVRFFGELTDNDFLMPSFSPSLRIVFARPSKGKEIDLSPMPGAEPTPPPSASTTPTTAFGSVRNEVLFRLGIMMLELGYSKPWTVLREKMELSLPENKRTEYHAAEKLAQGRLLRDKMGPKYQLVVRKCLGCDFGLGETDLENEDLQGSFLVDVVVALQEVSSGLATLNGHFHHT